MRKLFNFLLHLLVFTIQNKFTDTTQLILVEPSTFVEKLLPKYLKIVFRNSKSQGSLTHGDTIKISGLKPDGTSAFDNKTISLTPDSFLSGVTGECGIEPVMINKNFVADDGSLFFALTKPSVASNCFVGREESLVEIRLYKGLTHNPIASVDDASQISFRIMAGLDQEMSNAVEFKSRFPVSVSEATNLKPLQYSTRIAGRMKQYVDVTFRTSASGGDLDDMGFINIIIGRNETVSSVSEDEFTKDFAVAQASVNSSMISTKSTNLYPFSELIMPSFNTSKCSMGNVTAIKINGKDLNRTEVDNLYMYTVRFKGPKCQIEGNSTVSLRLSGYLPRNPNQVNIEDVVKVTTRVDSIPVILKPSVKIRSPGKLNVTLADFDQHRAKGKSLKHFTSSNGIIAMKSNTTTLLSISTMEDSNLPIEINVKVLPKSLCSLAMLQDLSSSNVTTPSQNSTNLNSNSTTPKQNQNNTTSALHIGNFKTQQSFYLQTKISKIQNLVLQSKFLNGTGQNCVLSVHAQSSPTGDLLYDQAKFQATIMYLANLVEKSGIRFGVTLQFDGKEVTTQMLQLQCDLAEIIHMATGVPLNNIRIVKQTKTKHGKQIFVATLRFLHPEVNQTDLGKGSEECVNNGNTRRLQLNQTSISVPSKSGLFIQLSVQMNDLFKTDSPMRAKCNRDFDSASFCTVLTSFLSPPLLSIKQLPNLQPKKKNYFPYGVVSGLLLSIVLLGCGICICVVPTFIVTRYEKKYAHIKNGFHLDPFTAWKNITEDRQSTNNYDPLFNLQSEQKSHYIPRTSVVPVNSNSKTNEKGKKKKSIQVKRAIELTLLETQLLEKDLTDIFYQAIEMESIQARKDDKKRKKRKTILPIIKKEDGSVEEEQKLQDSKVSKSTLIRVLETYMHDRTKQDKHSFYAAGSNGITLWNAFPDDLVTVLSSRKNDKNIKDQQQDDAMILLQRFLQIGIDKYSETMERVGGTDVLMAAQFKPFPFMERFLFHFICWGCVGFVSILSGISILVH
eukprot:g6466.t1